MIKKPFNQSPPTLGNQYDEDRVLRSYLKRLMPTEVLREVEGPLRELGELAGGELYRLQLEDRLNEPVLTQWNPWGERIDQIEVTPVWKRAEPLAAKYGVVAAGYEQEYGRFARPYQYALAYLFSPSTDVYSCPLAMTDGAARTLLRAGNQALIDRAVPHLTSRDPAEFWTSGQWMTESTGGSDVGKSETVARKDDNGQWRLYGRKWFTSAATSQMTLTLARPDESVAGGRGLALFYLECRDQDGRLNNIALNRLKDKLGTRKVPTAELMLEGTPATPVLGLQHGIRNIVPMLQVTRTWNSVTAVSLMRRGLALAQDYAHRREAFGATLADKPLHFDTMATLQAEMEAGFHLSFLLTELLGRDETGDISEHDACLLRLLTSVVKLTTGRQAVAVLSEVLEAFGGAGYVEDTGLPMLLRDAQVLPIWEGTTNVLSLDTLRALSEGPVLEALKAKVYRCTQLCHDVGLIGAGDRARQALEHALRWLETSYKRGGASIEAGARRFALTLGRSLALALLVEHANWSMANEHDGRARASAIRFSVSQIDHIVDLFDQDQSSTLDEVKALANNTPLPL